MPFLMTLASGSQGNCTLVSDGKTHILIDAGISARRIAAELKAAQLELSEISGILITHEHSDHIAGLGTLTRRYGLPVYAGMTTAGKLEEKFAGAQINPFAVGLGFTLGGMEISTFPTPHDTPESTGFVIHADRSRAVIATDMGWVPDEVLENLCRADLLLIEANHDIDMLKNGSYPYYLKTRILGQRGHLSNAACAAAVEIAVGKGAKRILLGHLSRDNNTPALALGGVRDALRAAGAEEEKDFSLTVAPRACHSQCYSF